MKRSTIAGALLLASVLAVTFSASVTLGACGSAVADSTSSSDQSSTTTLKADEGYIFVVRGATIAMNAPAAPILEQLGAWQSYNEAPSCAYQGMDKIYTYPGLQLTTYTVDDVDYVLSVLLRDDSLVTPEGIYVGSSLEEVRKAYGDRSTQNLTQYTYASGRMTLSFLFESDKLVQIEYLAKVE